MPIILAIGLCLMMVPACLFAQPAQQSRPIMRGTPMVLGKQMHASVAFATDIKHWQMINSLGLNTVRVCCVDPWYEDRERIEWKPEEVLPWLDKCVANAKATSLNIIINYHNVGEQDRQAKAGKPWDFNRLGSFWSLVAPRYKDQAHVFFELSNEPTFNGGDFLKPKFHTGLMMVYPAICTEWDYPGTADYVKQVDGKLLIAETCEDMSVGWIDWRGWDDTKLDRITNILIPDAKAKKYWWGK